MGLFGFLNKNKQETLSEKVYSPLVGELVSLDDVSDPVFSKTVLGKGMAIKPIKGELYSPVDGVVSSIFTTGHAIRIKTEIGADLLIHIGFNTVELAGKGFNSHVPEGKRIKAGELIVSFDLDEISKAGYDLTTPIIVTNKTGYEIVKSKPAGEAVDAKDTVFEIVKTS